MSGTIAEAQNAVNIGNIHQFYALRESVSFAEEVPLGCNEAVGADFEKVNSWMTVMTCSEAH